MPTAPYPDPFEVLRQALGRFEGSVNELSNRAMDTDRFTQALHQFSAVALGMQHVFEQVLDGVFRALHLPSRKDIDELATALQRIEDKLDRRVPEARPERPKPARTRRPLPEAAMPSTLASTASAAPVSRAAPADPRSGAAKPHKRPSARPSGPKGRST